MILGIGNNDCKGWNNWKKLGKDNIKYRTYILWKSMLTRCYSDTYHKTHPTYKGCFVCSHWLTLSNFSNDIKSLEGYKEWESNKTKYVLDKDVTIVGNKEYCSSACRFISITESNVEVAKRTKRNLVGIKKANCIKSLRVRAVLPDGSIKIYKSVRDTACDGYDFKHVSACCNGLRKTHKKCKFEFV